ncbi:S-layer homology domain-containing protein [Bacillus badius]|uniref:SLH domain-containing protein n=1 Tax=Bacillus badius TaxID=1455 RepID=A0ABR5AV67_BACBA|nr:S-layer homology domain-containing protein [Bacillus badius]KIL78622.1 hypothetical protein SD77_4302 [Bacillus badius]MED4716039.1 S-layer homology domain-containing protein [Bacillus badius]
MGSKQKSYRKFIAVSATATIAATAVTPAAAASFTDVTSPYKEAVNYLISKGIASGYPNGEFGIANEIKRVDMAIMLAKALKLNIEKAPSSGFTDVPTRGVKAVNALKAAGLVSGKTTKSFGSDQMMTRGEMALILAKAYKLTGTADLKFTDVAPRYQSAVKALVAAKITNGQTPTKFGTDVPIRRGEFAIFLYRAETLMNKPDEPEAPTLEVLSVAASTKTTVQVTFNTAVDSAAASNFSISGGTVTSVSLNNAKTVATLQVSGLADEKEYTLSFNNLKSAGKPANLSSKTFKTPAAPVKQWGLKASAGASTLTADGKASTEITYQLVDTSTGAVDTNASSIAIDVSTTKGSLDNTRITLQKGIAKVKLTAPVSTTDVKGEVTAKVASATGDYSSLVGKTAGTVSITFKKPAVDVAGPVPILIKASSTQADRLTLEFDRDIPLSALVQTNSKGELLYKYLEGSNWTSEVTKDKIPSDVKAGSIYHLLYNNGLVVKQNSSEKAIVGLKPVAGNSKAIEVIFEKSQQGTLTNNQAVDIEASPRNTEGQVVKSSVRFYLTDAKKPEAVSAQAVGQNQLKVNFSEPVAAASFKIDAIHTKGFTNEFGEFNPATLQDDRHTAFLTLDANYVEGTDKSIPGYFTSGLHKVEVSAISDLVGNTGGTKNLDFNVTANTTKPTATVKVESPKRFRVSFSTEVNEQEVERALELQYSLDGKTYQRVSNPDDYIVTKVLNKNEYMVEVQKDWTVIDPSLENYTKGKYQLFIPENSVTNMNNGVQNAAITLNLNYSGSLLNTLDSRKPALTSIERTDDVNVFIITMDEPVKKEGAVVEFTGKKSDGTAALPITGEVEGYIEDGTNRKFKVRAPELQELVNNEGYSSSWTVIVKNISDDVGNITEATSSKSLIVNKQANNVDFKLVQAAGATGTSNDTVTLTFSEGVQHRGGANDATVPGVYTLNGSALPEGTTISAADGDGNPKNGLEQVIVSLPTNTLKTVSNVITVKKGLVSYDGSVLIGDNSYVFQAK